MDCPRCGTRLTRISLNGELQSVYCERCRFADVESDHTSVSTGEETWDDALRRFRTANAEGEPEGHVDAESDPNDDKESDGDKEPDDDADAPAEDPGSESDHTADDTEAEEA